MSATAQGLEVKKLTEAEREYLAQLNREARIALQRHREAQRRGVECIAFLRQQHDAPEGEWDMRDDLSGFTRREQKIEEAQ